MDVESGGGVESTGRVGELTVDWGYWTLSGLVSGENEVTREEFQRVYIAVVDPANMDELKSVSGSWQYSTVASQFTGSGTGGSLTGLDMSFDVNLNSGAVSNGSFSADVAYGSESWTLNFSGSVEGSTATMNNFSNTTVVTPDAIVNGIEGSLGGVFSGNADNSAFVSGFSLQSDIGNLGGFGLLHGSPE